MTATDFLLDFCIASTLIVVSQLLRSKIIIIQKLLIPAPLIAGLIGLALGREGFNLLLFSESISSYTAILVNILFAGLFIGRKKTENTKKMLGNVSDTFFLNLAAEVGQFGFVILFGTLILSLFFKDTPLMMPVLAPGGFVGGHGYAAAIGGTLEQLGDWDEAITVGQTFATLGILIGVFGGIFLIKIAIKKGWTNYICDFNELPKELKTGFTVNDEKAYTIKNTTSSISVESLTWHLSLILVAVGMAYLINYIFEKLNLSIALPMMCVAMLCGVLLNNILNLLECQDKVDRETISKISSSVTDYLVFFGVASIKISVIIKYALPILILSLLCITFIMFHTFVICKKYFLNNWFERTIFIYGWTTGVVAIGITLLRIVDPEFKSGTLEDYGLAYTIISFIEIALIILVPTFIVYGHAYITAIVLCVFYIVLIYFTNLFRKRYLQSKKYSETKNN